jgi:hypothetical protein
VELVPAYQRFLSEAGDVSRILSSNPAGLRDVHISNHELMFFDFPFFQLYFKKTYTKAPVPITILISLHFVQFQAATQIMVHEQGTIYGPTAAGLESWKKSNSTPPTLDIAYVKVPALHANVAIV